MGIILILVGGAIGFFILGFALAYIGYNFFSKASIGLSAIASVISFAMSLYFLPYENKESPGYETFPSYNDNGGYYNHQGNGYYHLGRHRYMIVGPYIKE